MAELTRVESRTAGSVKQLRERRSAAETIPLVDAQEAERIYDASILRSALIGALGFSVLVSVLAYVIASGVWPIPGFGQFATAGIAPALFTGAGVGAALGALSGALYALYRLPARQRTP